MKAHGYNVRRLLVALALCLTVLAGCSKNSTEPTVDADPTGFYKIDVKTSALNKYNATGLKNGHIAYMRTKGNKWCEDVEFGETYSFWIKNVKSSVIGDSSLIQFDLELRTPSALGDGDLIDARLNYAIKYPNNPNFDEEGNADAAEVSAYIKHVLERNVNISKTAVTFISSAYGATSVGEVINKITGFLFKESKIKRSQIEGALIGIISFGEMRAMIKEKVETK